MGLAQELRRYRTLGLDTSCFIYYFEDDRYSRYANLIEPIFGMIESGRLAAVTSVISLAESQVLPRRLGNFAVVNQYRHAFRFFPHLTTAEITEREGEQAAQLRADYGFKMPDALQLAAALIRKVDIFLTNDRDLIRAKEIRVLILDDFTQ